MTPAMTRIPRKTARSPKRPWSGSPNPKSTPPPANSPAGTPRRHNITLDAEEFLTGGRTDSLAIAAFGRMFAQRSDLSIEAAIQRAHAFTTHATANEVDYFTAVDDLRHGDKGAGHLSYSQLTGGVYYWHANVDCRQLLATWTAADDPHRRLTALFDALFLALPTGKQNTAAHHTPPPVVLAVPAKIPASLQTAFETPIQARSHSGYLTPSITGLFTEHHRTVDALPSRFSLGPYPRGRYAGTADIDAGITRGVDRAASLDELAAWCAEQILATETGTR